MLKRGTLRAKIIKRTESALQRGALRPILTKTTFVRDGGIDFLVRIVSNLEYKAEEKKSREKSQENQRQDTNPFLPYDEEMFVEDISDTHVCLLNKFNVIDHHILIVTRAFEDQESLLTIRDFEALWTCMAEFDGLAFYNGGEVAGSSQPHKHLQMIPLPMYEKGPRVPIEPLIESARFDGDIGCIPDLPFVHALIPLSPDILKESTKAAEETFHIYRTMLDRLDLNRVTEPHFTRQAGPYNLLLTREWALLVPRSSEFFESISFNALAYTGALLVRDQIGMQILKDVGCMNALKSTAVPISAHVFPDK